MPLITYRVPQKGVNTRLSFKHDGTSAVLSDPKTQKTLITAKADQPPIFLKALRLLAAGIVVPVSIEGNGKVSTHQLALVEAGKGDWRPILLGEAGGIGGYLPGDDDTGDDGSGNVQPMLDPVTGGVIVVGILAAAAVVWHAIDEGATLDIKVGKDGVTVAVDGNGPDQLPDNGDNPQLPGD